MQPGHVDAEIGGLEQILDLLGVRVEPGRVDVDVGREDAVNHRAKGRRGNTGVPANGIVTKTVDHLKIKALNVVYILAFRLIDRILSCKEITHPIYLVAMLSLGVNSPNFC